MVAATFTRSSSFSGEHPSSGTHTHHIHKRTHTFTYCTNKHKQYVMMYFLKNISLETRLEGNFQRNYHSQSLNPRTFTQLHVVLVSVAGCLAVTLRCRILEKRAPALQGLLQATCRLSFTVNHRSCGHAAERSLRQRMAFVSRTDWKCPLVWWRISSLSLALHQSHFRSLFYIQISCTIISAQNRIRLNLPSVCLSVCLSVCHMFLTHQTHIIALVVQTVLSAL